MGGEILMSKPEKKRILIVDDCAALTNLAKHIVVSQHEEYEPLFACSAEEAIAVLIHEKISLVLTDYQMPGMNGLELLSIIQQIDSSIPVIVMTAFEDGNIEFEAISRGAVGFLRKSRLAQELPGRLLTTLQTSSGRMSFKNRPSVNCIHEQATQQVIPNDRSLVPEIVVYCQDLLNEFEICERQDQIRVGIAIEEALVNAMIHGNFEIGSELRGVDDAAHALLIEERSGDKYYASRQVSLNIHMTSNLGRFVIRDEGLGFDTSKLPDPTNQENIVKASGRGLLLIRRFTDELHHNDTGNEITIVKYKTVPEKTDHIKKTAHAIPAK